MIPARHTRFHVWFFRWYTRIGLRRNFSKIRVHEPLPVLDKRPVLVIANHFSWWDGFFILWLNDRFLGRKFHVMMLEEQLTKNRILNKTGAFSIRKGTRDAVASLRYANQLLAGDGKNLVLMYPQGAIRSMHQHSLSFEKGVERITQGLEGRIQIVLVNILTDYFSAPKPELHFRMELFPFEAPLDIKDLESAYNRFFNRSIVNQTAL